MTYAKQIVQAAMLATMRQLGVLDEEMPDVSGTIDIDAIIASVPKPEPFGYFRCDPAFGWEDCAEDAECAIALYEAHHIGNVTEMVGIARERDLLMEIISDFCDGQDWADGSWKDQAHIKPLFDAAKGVTP